MFSVVKAYTRLSGTLAVLALAIAANPGALRAQQPAPPPPRYVDAQARQMLDRVIQILGGPAFLTAKSLTTKGRVFFFQDGNTAGMEPYQSWFVYPDKRRFSYGKTKPVILINNGEQGWELDQYGLISQPEKQLSGWIISNRYSVENLLRNGIKQSGVLIQTGKVDFVDNMPTQGIEITEPGGISVLLELHRQTSLPVRISYRIWNEKANDWDEYSDTYADFRPVDGVQIPMHVTRYLNDERIGETFRNFAKLNEDYPANYFNPE